MTPSALPRNVEPLHVAADAFLSAFVEQDDAAARLCRRALIDPGLEFLCRPSKGIRARLVRHAWVLANGDPDLFPEELAAAIELLHAGSLIVDDIEDDSDERRGGASLHRSIGMPLAINTGNCLYFVAMELLGRVGDDRVAAAIYRRTSRTLIECHRGQAVDLSTRIDELTPELIPGVVAATTSLKTSALMRLGSGIAAIAAGATGSRVVSLEGFGADLGTALQMLDDLGGLTAAQRRRKGHEDLRHGRPTWPWAWLAELDPDGCAQLQADSRCATGEPDLDRIADELSGAIGVYGRERVTSHLGDAFHRLRRDLGQTGALAAVEHEIRRLERSYG